MFIKKKVIVKTFKAKDFPKLVYQKKIGCSETF